MPDFSRPPGLITTSQKTPDLLEALPYFRHKKNSRIGEFSEREDKRAKTKLVRPGSDLLSRVLRQSTIGVSGFHGRVRNGIGCFSAAITTGSNKLCPVFKSSQSAYKGLYLRNNNQVNQAISIGRLHASQHFHPRPINVVVFHGLNWDTLFQGRLPA